MNSDNQPSEIFAETRDLEHNNGEDDLQQLKPGKILENRYHIDRVLGIGGMGAVYQAHDLRFRVTKHVAVKEIVSQGIDSAHQEKLAENFAREANIIASLSHHAIPKIYDYFTLGTRSYLVMEFIQGDNLEKILENLQELIPVQQIITWAIDLCGVLEHLHSQEPDPIIFRDIKPANIIITPDQNVVLVDFGIAKEFQTGHKGTIIGTEGYSPPEQYRGESTPLVDIYALGATLHHMLSGIDPRDEPPFTFAERSIRQLNSEVPIELENIVNTALQYNAEDRLPSAEAMKKALLPLARTAANTYRPHTPSNIQEAFAIEPLWVFKCQDEIRASAKYYNGTIYVGAYDNNLYAINAVTGEKVWEYPTDGGIVSAPSFHADGIFIGSEDHRLHAISEYTGGIMWAYYTGGPVRSSPTISEDHIFIGSDDNHLHIINAKSGRGTTKFNAGAPVQTTPLVNEESVFFGTQNGDFFCIDFRGQIKWRANAKRAIVSSARLQNNVVYFGALDSLFYALNAKTGRALWRFRMDRGTISTPAITEKHAFIGSADGHIYCIDLNSNKQVWKFKTGHQVSSSPVIHENFLYCGSVDGKLYCLDSQTGQLLWKYETGGSITGTPTIHDNILYIGSIDKNLYALPI
ncbi:MAG: serine/threonine-protein kinase [Chloroflexi bacterium]|nr:serine/threonine-protein kinase [Chloroflexota bacterium]